MDKISELPQHLVHHILCFLSQKEAVQTCVLGKSWRYLWSTRPKLEFVELKDFQGDHKEKLMHVLNKTLQGYHDQNLGIDKFVLWTSAPRDSEESIPQLKKWIPIVIRNMGVKELDLTLFMKEHAYFDLPPAVFQSESLLKLSLFGCNLNYSCCSSRTSVVLLKHLRKLCLQDVDIADETFEKIMLGCPLIEHVNMFHCKGLRTIKVNKAPNLDYFKFSNRGEDYHCSIEIDVPTIESIEISSEWKWFYRHKHFGHLKSLKLERVLLTRDLFRNFSSNFPCVEELGLKSCTGSNRKRAPSKKIKLSSVSIKRLVIGNMEKFKAAFDTPNIVEFVYQGYVPQSISFTTTTSQKWASDLSLMLTFRYDDFDASSRFQKLHQLLGALSQSVISLRIVSYNLYPIIEGDIIDRGSYEPVEVEQLRLDLFKFHSFSSFSAFINALFGVCHPRGIYRYWYTSSAQDKDEEENHVTEFLCKILCVDERNKDQEAADRMLISWQRDVEEVSFFETFGADNKEEWHRVHNSWLEYCAALLPPENLEDPHYLCFLLKWS